MISQFSSLIEFIVAVYVTMSLDYTICNQFWTPDYLKDIKRALEGVSSINKDFCESIISTIADISERIKNNSRKKGGFMLGFCIMLLIYIGFENEHVSKVCGRSLSLICILVLVITTCFQKYIFKKWKHVVFLLIFLCSSFVILSYNSTKLEALLSCETTITEGSFIISNLPTLLLVLSLLIPILHQLFTNWIYSRVYKEYYKKKLVEEIRLYNDSKQGIELRQKEKVALPYLSAFNDSYFDGEDRNITSLNNVLFNRLLALSRPPIWKLLLSYFKYQFFFLFTHIKESVNKYRNSDVHSHEELPDGANTGNITYELYYTKLLTFQKARKGNVRDSCKKEGIDAKKFIAWIHLNKPKKST